MLRGRPQATPRERARACSWQVSQGLGPSVESGGRRVGPASPPGTLRGLERCPARALEDLHPGGPFARMRLGPAHAVVYPVQPFETTIPARDPSAGSQIPPHAHGTTKEA